MLPPSGGNVTTQVSTPLLLRSADDGPSKDRKCYTLQELLMYNKIPNKAHVATLAAMLRSGPLTLSEVQCTFEARYFDELRYAIDVLHYAGVIRSQSLPNGDLQYTWVKIRIPT
jgi:hypothetical protein